MGKKFLICLAWITRRFHPRGTERILRILHNPDTVKGFETIIPYGEGLRIHINTGSFVEWFTFFKGYWEDWISAFIKDKLPVGGVFVDVGANVGVHTLIAARKVGKYGRVIAVEPVPELTQRLKSNVDLNDIKNTIIIEKAASDKSGAVSFYKGRGSQKEIASLYKNHALGEEITVEAQTLDDLLKDEPRVDLIKIDTEGHDGRVILGARKTIEEYKPIILFELADDSWHFGGVGYSRIEGILRNLGYTVTRYREDGGGSETVIADWDNDKTKR